MKVACIQGPLIAGSPQFMLAELDRAMAQSAGARLMVAPELFLTGYNVPPETIARLAEPADGPSAQLACALAARHQMGLVYGYPERATDGSLYNSALVIGPDGQVLANYRKIHLFGAVENAVFARGHDPVVLAEFDGLRTGFLICYDVEFPEMVRGLALAGADLIVVPTAQMRPYEFVPRVMLPARAYENQVFVMYVNRCGQEGDLVYTGESCIVAPDGSFLARAGDGEEILSARLDVTLLANSRARNTYLRDRQPAFYNKVVAP